MDIKMVAPAIFSDGILTKLIRKFVGKGQQWLTPFQRIFAANKRAIVTLILLLTLVLIYFKPQQFADIWLTKDQQGQMLFLLGDYEKASAQFNDTQWQAFSAYGAEDYKNSASLYGQFNNKEMRLAKANALSHHRDYVKAKVIYLDILSKWPNDKAATNNLAIIQAIIDETNRLSESQQAEQGESSKELGDEPQAGDGAEREYAETQEVEQLTSEQLLLDPSLNEMWLRQVQKNPARFLSQKFYMQLENAANSGKAASQENTVKGGEDVQN